MQPNDIVVSSKKLQQLFIDRCIALEVAPSLIAEKCDVDYDNLSEWIKSSDPDKAPISQKEVIRLLNFLKCDVQIIIGVLPLDKMSDEDRKKIRKVT